jgi:hypothetical protein
MLKSAFWFILLFVFTLGKAGAQKIYDSRNGYNLPVSGTIRIAVILVEVNYTSPDVHDPTGENGWGGWQKHSLPEWAMNPSAGLNAFDAFDTGTASGRISLYFSQASFGKFHVIADYIKCPDNGGIFSVDSPDGVVTPADAIKSVNKKLGGKIETLHSLNNISYFNLWNLSLPGLPKERIRDSISAAARKWDHVMIIWRNNQGKRYNATAKKYDYDLVTGNGYCSAGSPGELLGYNASTFSNFSIYGELNENIIRHEFSHMLYGGNNFHVAGGGAGDPNYWIPKISGYSNLSLYDATLACWNGWDRQRLGWKPDGNKYFISAGKLPSLTQANGDLDVNDTSGEGIYVLRDFITTGDAIRIKLPFTVPGKEYNEYLWIENHNGKDKNKSPFDRWFYEGNCITHSAYGLYMYMQIDKDINSSQVFNDVYGGYCDFLRMITADGFYDRILDTILVPEQCLNNIPVRPFRRISERQNPLTGQGDNDMMSLDLDKNHQLTAGDQYVNDIENTDGKFRYDFVQNGNNRQVFTSDKNKKIGMATNPCTATQINLVSYNSAVRGAKNIRSTYLNGVSAEILKQDSSGAITIRIRFNDTDIDNDVRWCSPEIILNDIQSPGRYSLHLCKEKILTLDLGFTPTRMDSPITFNHEDVFTSSTKMICKKNSSVMIDTSAQIILKNGSILQADSESKILMSSKSKLLVKDNSVLMISGLLTLNPKSLVQIDTGATIEFLPGAKIIFNGNARMKINGTIIQHDNNSQLQIHSDKHIRLGSRSHFKNTIE